MRRHSSLPERGARARPLALAIGVFDGIHLGHQAVLRAAVRLARREGWTAAALTFDPPPEAALGLPVPPRLGHPDEQAAVMAGLGLDELFRMTFSPALGRLSPKAFAARVLAGRLRCGAVVVGRGFRFGAGARGAVRDLEDLGRGLGFVVEEVPPYLCGGRPVSSTRLRRAVRTGRLDEAAALLGRPWRFRGRVVAGRRLGRTLGFPTANLEGPQQAIPPRGIWVGRCRRAPHADGRFGGDHRWWGFAGNLGVRPTLGEGLKPSVELHLLGFRGSLYGRVLEAEFLGFLRPEKKFHSLDALSAQISKDVVRAKGFLKGF